MMELFVIWTFMNWPGLHSVSALLRYCTLKAHFGTPPFDPNPSQYIWPPPSIIEPGAPVIVTLLPAIWRGLN